MFFKYFASFHYFSSFVSMGVFVYYRGWGLRCLDDIPKGGFICIYAGQLLTDTGANEVRSP